MSEFEQVMSSLMLDRLEDNLFESRSPAVGWRRIYGGLLLAHAVHAAQQTVDAGKQFHSVHASFLRPGNTGEPMRILVERLLDGRTVTHRRITITQIGKPVFIASVSFRSAGEGLDYAPRMPRIPEPDALEDETSICEANRAKLGENATKYLSRQKVFEIRPVDPDQFLFGHGRQAGHMPVWLRLRSASVPEPVFDAALLAYLSDMPVLNASLGPHQRTFFDSGLSLASLDHALWQHARPDWSDWLLATHDSLATEAGMGLGQVRIFNRNGILCSTVCQQGFIRPSID